MSLPEATEMSKEEFIARARDYEARLRVFLEQSDIPPGGPAAFALLHLAAAISQLVEPPLPLESFLDAAQWCYRRHAGMPPLVKRGEPV